MKPSVFCVLFLASALAAIACVFPQCACAGTTDTQRLPLITLHGSLPDIDNFDQVSPTLFRGSAPDEEDIATLQKLGVKTIIDIRMHRSRKEEQAARAAGIEYMHMPMGYWAPSQQHVDRILSVILDPARGPVYLHCRQGADRTGTLVGIYRVTVDRWPFKRAYAEMRAHHFKPWWFALRERVETFAEEYAVAER